LASGVVVTQLVYIYGAKLANLNLMELVDLVGIVDLLELVYTLWTWCTLLPGGLLMVGVLLVVAMVDRPSCWSCWTGILVLCVWV
jgi:hypothetical protein